MKSKGFKNANTESNTLWLKNNQNYDYLIMGISHARNFSRGKNQEISENLINAKLANLAQGSGICGVNEQHFYLKYFLSKQNKATTIIYILSPPMMFSKTLPIASNTFKYENFDFDFLKKYVFYKAENKSARIMSYLQRKLHPRWFLYGPSKLEKNNTKLDTLDIDIVKKGQNLAYSGKALNMVRFNYSCEILEESITLAKNNETKVKLVIPPALFGKWRGHDETLNFAIQMKNKYNNVDYLDASETVFKPEFYYDNHHLNTDGIIYFIKNYLNPFLNK